MAQSQSKPLAEGERLYYLDNFRTYLTLLVIYHHTAIPYGGLGSWFYTSRFHTPGTSLPLMAFNSIDQSYFMASFFFLSGYFSVRSLRKKGALSFLKTKFMKLGIPMIAYTLLGPSLQIALQKAYRGESLSLDILMNAWRNLRGITGPVWYCALVLIFDSVRAALSTNLPPVPQIGIIPAIALDIAANFLIRLLYPIGSTFNPLNLQPAFLPQYIASYTLGASLDSPPTPPITDTTRSILIASSVTSSAALLGLLHYYPDSYSFASSSGGLNLVALVSAVWGETTGYVLGTSILNLFKSPAWLNRSWGRLGSYSYAAFLVHPVVCVAVQIWADEWAAGAVMKTVVLGTAGALGSWSVAWGLVRVPGMRNFLV
jgi:glucan biosynthesis protein C